MTFNNKQKNLKPKFLVSVYSEYRALGFFQRASGVQIKVYSGSIESVSGFTIK